MFDRLIMASMRNIFELSPISDRFKYQNHNAWKGEAESSKYLFQQQSDFPYHEIQRNI